MYTRFFILFVILAMLIFMVACSSDNPTQPDNNAGSQTSLSKLSEIQNKVFTNSCALTGCHGTSNNQANLLLTEGQSYSNLVNVQSVLFPQYKRVVPGNSSESLIIKILKGEVSPRMPLNRDPLSAEVIDSIAVWIDHGALNN